MFFSQIEATTDMKNKRKRLASKAMEANLVYFGQKKIATKVCSKKFWMEYFQKKVPNTKNQNFEIFYQKIRQIEVRLQKCKQTFTNFLS